MTEELSELRAELALTIDARNEAIQERDEARAERDRMAKDLGQLRLHGLTAATLTAAAFNRLERIEDLARRLFEAMDRAEGTDDNDDAVITMAELIGELRPLLQQPPASLANVEPK